MPWTTDSHIPTPRRPLPHDTTTLWDLNDRANPDATGFFSLAPHPTLTDLIYVRWAKFRNYRYALRVGRPEQKAVRHITYDEARQLYDPEVRAGIPTFRLLPLTYERGWSGSVLKILTPDDRVPAPRLLRLLSSHGPYDLCALCSRTVSTDPVSRTFGLGSTCAREKAHVPHKTLRIMYDAHVAGGIDDLSRLANKETS